MKIHKIKVDKDPPKITIKYSKTSRKDPTLEDEYTVISWDEALPNFFIALDNLRQHVYKICEINDEIDKLIEEARKYVAGDRAIQQRTLELAAVA